MNNELVTLMKEYVDASHADREEMKQDIKQLVEALNNLTVQITELKINQANGEQRCSVRTSACDKLHEDFEVRLRAVPSAQVQQDLKKKIDELRPMVYKFAGIITGVSLLSPFLVKLIFN